MHEPPTYTTWKITCQSAEEADSLRQWLGGRIDLDRVVTDTIRTAADGVEQVQTEEHRLGDYFEAIRILADSSTSFRLLFHRRVGAGRFWKDLMVGILREIEGAPRKAWIQIHSKGDVEPFPIGSAAL